MSAAKCPRVSLVTAALLAAALAAEGIANIAPPGPGAYDGVCHTENKGNKSSNTVRVSPIVIPALQADFEFDIPNKCAEQNMELVGGAVTACDSDEPPILTLPPGVAGKGSVRRSGTCLTTAHCYVQLYCI